MYEADSAFIFLKFLSYFMNLIRGKPKILKNKWVRGHGTLQKTAVHFNATQRFEIFFQKKLFGIQCLQKTVQRVVNSAY